MLWIFQALGPPKQRYSWARVDGWRPFPGVRRLKYPLSAEHISELCRGKRQYLCCFPVPSAERGGGVWVKITDVKHMNVYMYMVFMYFGCQFEAVPAYVMSQWWLRTRAFLTMKDAPRIENLLSHCRSQPLRSLH